MQLHGLTVMKRVQKQKHLITIISFLFLAWSSILVLLLKWQPPLMRLPWGVPSCPDRRIFSSLCPRISMSDLSIVPFILPQWDISPAQTLIHLLNVLMIFWPPTDRGHKFDCTCCKDLCLPVISWRTHRQTAFRWLHVCDLHHLPELIKAEIQPFGKMAICVSKEVWNVFTVVSDEGNL